MTIKCDGNHGGPRCADPHCWNDAPPTWCFTFGCGSPLARYYVEIEGEDEHQARCRMVAMFAGHWASVYPRAEFQPQIAEYGLLPLVVNKAGSVRLGTHHEPIPLDIYQRAFPW